MVPPYPSNGIFAVPVPQISGGSVCSFKIPDQVKPGLILTLNATEQGIHEFHTPEFYSILPWVSEIIAGLPDL